MTLEDHAVVAVRGADRATWLNGVVTQDLRGIAPGASVYAAVLGVKGKILTDAFVLGREDELLVVLPAARCEAVLEHFDRYLVMEDVTLDRLDAEVITVQGPRAREALAGFGETFAVDRLSRGGGDLVVGSDAKPGVEAEIARLLRDGALARVTPEAWEIARIDGSVPAFGKDFDGNNFVQEAGITARAVSFQKGCYLGQEVVCRLEMRGQVQRHLATFSVEGPAPLAGAAITRDGATVGAVSSSAPSRNVSGESRFFAMVKRSALETPGQMAVDGRAVTQLPSRP